MQGFISYTHADAKYLDRLVVHLKAIERITPFRFWYDKERLSGGDQFDELILRAIEDSEIFILLVSPRYFSSDYIFEREIPAITAKKSKTNCPVVPVILQRCLWEAWLEGLLAVPSKPILEWSPSEHGFDAANREIAKIIYTWCRVEPSSLLTDFLAGGVH